MRKWLKYFTTFYPVKEIHSPINGRIKVIMAFNMPRLIIDGILQSGGLMRKIWDKGIGKLKRENRKIKEVLIVGLGCGDCAFRIEKYYPKAKIVGVEIDKEIVDIAQCYFNLAILKNLTVNIEDGVKYVFQKAKVKKIKKFDLIVIDVYIGETMPKAFRTKKFHQQLIKLLNKKGVVIINQLFFKKYKKKAEEFVESLDSIYSKITLQRVASNLLIHAEV